MQIRPVTDLRNKFADISRIVHEEATPVFLTKNGYGDMVVMSLETYERITGKAELYRLLDEGMADLNAGRTRPADEVFADIEGKFHV